MPAAGLGRLEAGPVACPVPTLPRSGGRMHPPIWVQVLKQRSNTLCALRTRAGAVWCHRHAGLHCTRGRQGRGALGEATHTLWHMRCPDCPPCHVSRWHADSACLPAHGAYDRRLSSPQRVSAAPMMVGWRWWLHLQVLVSSTHCPSAHWNGASKSPKQHTACAGGALGVALGVGVRPSADSQHYVLHVCWPWLCLCVSAGRHGHVLPWRDPVRHASWAQALHRGRHQVPLLRHPRPQQCAGPARWTVGGSGWCGMPKPASSPQVSLRILHHLTPHAACCPVGATHALVVVGPTLRGA